MQSLLQSFVLEKKKIYILWKKVLIFRGGGVDIYDKDILCELFAMRWEAKNFLHTEIGFVKTPQKICAINHL